MPSNGTFTGVWFSPQYGRMDLMQQGASVVGEYTKDERHGRLQGYAKGDVLRFEWHERREMIVGRPIETRGRGYFRYVVDADGDHKLVGEWGHDDDEIGGGPWNGVKSKKLKPKLTTDGNGPPVRSSGGESDSSSGEGTGDSQLNDNSSGDSLNDL